MKVTVENGSVTIFTPAVDAKGAPLLFPDGTPMGNSRTMTLAQYQLHARAPEFASSIPVQAQADIAAAIAAAASQ